jgi:hypothetical protein
MIFLICSRDFGHQSLHLSQLVLKPGIKMKMPGSKFMRFALPYLHCYSRYHCHNHQIILNQKQISMKKNMGNTDRIIRLVIAAIVVALYLTNTITGTLGLVLLVLSGIFVATSLVSFCPLYVLFGINTCPVKTKTQ